MLSQRDWIELGRSVSWLLPEDTGETPKADDLKAAAWELGLTVYEARQAYEAFTQARQSAQAY